MSTISRVASRETMIKQPLQRHELKFEPSSIIDGAGQLFWWNDEVYRGIRPTSAQFYRDLFEQRNIETLFERYLVPGEISSLEVDSFDLVLHHYRIPTVSYCMEWSSEMLRDAALLLCDLSRALYAKGLTLKDAHPWNVLFDMGKPIYVDWGSIIPLKQGQMWPYREFQSWFILPLYLMGAGKSHLARALMLDVRHPMSFKDVFCLLLRPGLVRRWLSYCLIYKPQLMKHTEITPRFFDSLRRLIEEIPTASETTAWSNYYGLDRRYSFDAPEGWPDKVRNVVHCIRSLRPKTMLDLGCNRGWMSKLAAHHGIHVIAADLDEISINILYQFVKAENLSIIPLVLDFCALTPPHGLFQSYASASTRLRSEMVLALALTHHLVFKQNLTFDIIANQLSCLTQKWLLVEFVPPDDVYVNEWMSDQYNWYHLEGFHRSLSNQFKKIKILDSTPSPRVLLLCEK